MESCLPSTSTMVFFKPGLASLLLQCLTLLASDSDMKQQTDGQESPVAVLPVLTLLQQIDFDCGMPDAMLSQFRAVGMQLVTKR